MFRPAGLDSRAIAISLTIWVMAASDAQALVVNFDNFFSPTDNDYETFFTDSDDPPYFTQQPTDGITGGALLPGIFGSFGNTGGHLNETIENAVGAVHEFSVSFLFDSSLINPNRFDTLVSFDLSTPPGSSRIFGGVRFLAPPGHQSRYDHRAV